MNFRYQAIVFAFLAVAIHFHNGDAVGTISLAQSAAPAAPTVTAPPKPADDPNLKFNEETENGNMVYFRAVEEALDPDTIEGRLNKNTKRIVVKAYADKDGKTPLSNTQGDTLKLFGDCEGGCRTEFKLLGSLESEKDLKEVQRAIEQAKKRYDIAKTNEKKLADLKAEKEAKCEDMENAQVTVTCLLGKIKLAKNDTEKNELKTRLGEIVLNGMKNEPDSTMKYLEANKDAMKMVPAALGAEIRLLGLPILAGKNAFASASAIELARDKCLEAIRTDPRSYLRTTRIESCNRTRSAAISKDDNSFKNFRKEFSNVFGVSSSGIPGSSVTEAWKTANGKHESDVAILKDARLITEQNLLGMEVMADASDVRPTFNTSLRSDIMNIGLDVDGDIDNLGQRSVVTGQGRNRQAQRRNNSQAYGGCRAGVTGKDCPDPYAEYVARLKTIVTAGNANPVLMANGSNPTMGNFGSSLSGVSGRGRPQG